MPEAESPFWIVFGPSLKSASVPVAIGVEETATLSTEVVANKVLPLTSQSESDPAAEEVTYLFPLAS